MDPNEWRRRKKHAVLMEKLIQHILVKELNGHESSTFSTEKEKSIQ